MDSKRYLSLVIPVYNEEDNVKILYNEISKTMKEIDADHEIIFIDDGSVDETSKRLKEIQHNDSNVVLIFFRRNFGQTAALSAGFDYAQGDIVITMDGDLQNDPKDIPQLLKKIKDYDIVCGWRQNRQDKTLSRKLPSAIANKLISWVTGVKLKDYGCTLKAFRKEIIKNIRLYGEMHRFIPAIASGMGISYCEIPTNHRARQFGQTKYGISRTIRVILDLMTVKFMLSYYTRPIHVFGFLGLGVGSIGFLICLYLSILKMAFGQSIANRPLLLLGVLMIVLSACLIVLGLLGEILVRIYYESQHKPIYAIQEICPVVKSSKHKDSAEHDLNHKR
jgi:glycosyltransferase involved in cell wall biosynthesis